MIHLESLINSNSYDHCYHPGILSCPRFSSSLVFVRSIFPGCRCMTRPVPGTRVLERVSLIPAYRSKGSCE